MSVKKPVEPNYMVIKIDTNYDQKLVLPYKEGIALLEALENAKIYQESYNNPSLILGIKSSTIVASSIGVQEYGEATLRAAISCENTATE